MSRFKFSENYSSTIGNIRVSDGTHHKLKSIAKQKNVSIQEVVRVFIDFALDEFSKEYPEHFLESKPRVTYVDSKPTQTK